MCQRLMPGVINGFETDYALGLAAKGKAVNLRELQTQEIGDLDELEKGY